MKDEIRCDTCGHPIDSTQALIIWDEEPYGYVNVLKIVHRGPCDQKEYDSSAGAAYGARLEPEHERAVFSAKKFACSTDRSRVMRLCRIQEKFLEAAHA